MHKVWWRRGHRRSYYRHRSNAVAAGAVFGLALGAILANQAAQYNRSVEWCMRRRRSYDPRSHAWIDYHDRIRYCP